MKIVVVGAGFGGLSVASLLAAQGHSVALVEKNDRPGGRAMSFQQDGFTFDMGPSWYLMPEVFERFFAQFDKSVSDYYTLDRLDPSYRVFFENSESIDIAASLNDNLKLFDSLEPGGAEKLKAYLKRAEYQYRVSMEHFLYRDYQKLFDFFNRRLIFEGSRLGVFQSLDRCTRKFFDNDRLRKILEYNVVFLGGDPVNTPALYSIMSHVDFNLGVWYPRGGMGSVVNGLVELAKSLGVSFSYSNEVSEILVRQGSVAGVKCIEGEIAADTVVVNADYAHAEIDLLAPEFQSYPPSYWGRRMLAPSAFLLYLGVSKKLPGLKHHSLFFIDQWQEHFDQIFKMPAWPENPCYYVCCPSQSDPTVAPDGRENVFILVPVAAGLADGSSGDGNYPGGDDHFREQYSEKVISHLEGLIGESIRDSLVYKRIFSQRDFQSEFNAYKGTALSLSHSLFQTAFFRPSHRSKKVKNLYFSGQYTHPGIGVPMTLISSQVVAERIAKEAHG